jgi:hypothetical protein
MNEFHKLAAAGVDNYVGRLIASAAYISIAIYSKLWICIRLHIKCNDLASNSIYVASNDLIIVNNKLKRMMKKVAMAY